MSMNDPEAVRVARVQQLFQTRYPGKRTGTDVLIFFGWLVKHNPDLLPKEKEGDPYQHLKMELLGLYSD